MKKILPLLFITMMACSSQQNSDAQKQAIVNFLQEDVKGVKTDLKIEVSQLEITDITVADSIAILEAKFQSKIKEAENSIKNFQENIERSSEEIKSLDRSNWDDLAKISANESANRLYQRGLEKAESTLVKVQEQKSSVLEKYENRDKNQLLMKKAVATFSFFNPSLQTRQERIDDFVLSKDGSEVLGIMQNGKLRRKK